MTPTRISEERKWHYASALKAGETSNKVEQGFISWYHLEHGFKKLIDIIEQDRGIAGPAIDYAIVFTIDNYNNTLRSGNGASGTEIQAVRKQILPRIDEISSEEIKTRLLQNLISGMIRHYVAPNTKPGRIVKLRTEIKEAFSLIAQEDQTITLEAMIKQVEISEANKIKNLESQKKPGVLKEVDQIKYDELLNLFGELEEIIPTPLNLTNRPPGKLASLPMIEPEVTDAFMEKTDFGKFNADAVVDSLIHNSSRAKFHLEIIAKATTPSALEYVRNVLASLRKIENNFIPLDEVKNYARAIRSVTQAITSNPLFDRLDDQYIKGILLENSSVGVVTELLKQEKIEPWLVQVKFLTPDNVDIDSFDPNSEDLQTPLEVISNQWPNVATIMGVDPSFAISKALGEGISTSL